MSETRSRPRLDQPFGTMEFEAEATQPRLMPAVAANSAADQATANIITAQRVAIKRDVSAILKEARAIATAGGEAFYYSIPFKERRNGVERTVRVEGPTIGCAMAALNAYGNCTAEAFPAKETGDNWTFLARFVDLEKGVTITRAFNQRKGQNVGMKDSGRGLDLIFQIGQSKAIRNVVVAGLKWLVDDMEKHAKSGVLQRIERDPERARQWLLDHYETLGVDVKRVERVVARPAAKWLAQDMAKLVSEMQAILDEMADADQLYPTPEAVAEQKAGERAPPDPPRTAAPTPKPKAETAEGPLGPEPPPPDEPAPKPATRRAAPAKAAAPPPPKATTEAPIENAPYSEESEDPAPQPGPVRQAAMNVEARRAAAAQPPEEEQPGDENLDFG